MNMRRFLRWIVAGGVVALLAACGSLPSDSTKVGAGETAADLPARGKGNDVVLFALGLIETGYRFGGKNPEAGLDCSGMVGYVYRYAADIPLQGSAADLARKGKSVERERMRPGDLVFFNTRNKPKSHVGIYIGGNRFVHAPSSRGKVRTESLSNPWFAARYEGARTYLD